MAGLTRRELLKHRHGRSGVRVPALSPPERLHSLKVTSSLVSIAWRRSHDHGPRAHYEVLRNGRHLAHARTPRFDDHRVKPGTAYRYSNSGYVLLGYLIEKITGQRYRDFVEENIFKPLRMKDSGYDSNTAIIPHRAAGYSPGPNGPVNAGYAR